MPKFVTLSLLVAGMLQAVALGAAPVAVAPSIEEFSDFSLEFSASPGCPERAEFESELLARTPAARLREAGAGTLALAVALVAEPTTFAGVLTITLPNGARSERTVDAASCRDASLSLAVIASLVLEAYREHRPLPGAETPASPNAAEPNADTSANSATPPAAEVATVTPARPARPPVPTPPAGARHFTPRLNFGLFGALALETAVAESPPLGALAGIYLERRGHGAWSPSARVGGLFTTHGSSRANAGSAAFRLMAARLALCPLRLAASRRLSFAPCVELDAGALRGGESNAPNPTARHMPWLGLGAAGRAEWALGRLVSLDAFAGLRWLSHHDRFVLVAPGNPARSAVLYDVPAWSAGFGVGAAVRLPQ